MVCMDGATPSFCKAADRNLLAESVSASSSPPIDWSLDDTLTEAVKGKRDVGLVLGTPPVLFDLHFSLT